MRGLPLFPWLVLGILFSEWVLVEVPTWVCWGLAVMVTGLLFRGGVLLSSWTWVALVVVLGIAVAKARSTGVTPVEKGWLSLTALRSVSSQGSGHRAICADQHGTRWLWHSEERWPVGMQGVALGTLRAWPEPAHPWDFDASAFWAGRGVSVMAEERFRLGIRPTWRTQVESAMAVTRGHLVDRMMRAQHVGLGRGLLLGLATGRREDMAFADRQAFSQLGLAHLTAVSGFHVGLWLWMSMAALSWVPIRWRMLACQPGIWGYVGLCGAPNSALRAACMAGLVALAVATGRKLDAWRSLTVAAGALWILEPAQVHDVGTQLSFLATAGILHWNQQRRASGARNPWRAFHAWLAIPWVATASTAPVAWPTFGQFPVAFWPANLLVSPVVTVLMWLLAVSLLLPFSMGGESMAIALWLSDGVVRGVQWASEVCPAIRLPLDGHWLQMAGLVLAVGTMVGLCPRRWPWMGVGVVLALALLRWQSGCDRDLQVVSLSESGDVVVSQWGRVSPLPAGSNGARLKWKTRSCVERVSSKPPLPWTQGGNGWVWTPEALCTRSDSDTLVWVSSSASPVR